MARGKTSYQNGLGQLYHRYSRQGDLCEARNQKQDSEKQQVHGKHPRATSLYARSEGGCQFYRRAYSEQGL